MVKTLRNWRDLWAYGFNCLTGEACGYNYRLLVDVDEKAIEIIKKVMDLPEITVRENWNSGSIGSIMLPHCMFEPIAVFCLLNDGYEQVYTTEDGIIGASGEENDSIKEMLSEEDKKFEEYYYANGNKWPEWTRLFGGVRRRIKNTNPRNVHQMSGRVV